MDSAVAEANSNRKKEELLVLAANHGFVGDVENLLGEGADAQSKDKQGVAAIHFACSKGHLDVVQLLLSRGVDVDTEDPKGRTPLHYAVLGESVDIVRHLIKKGAWLDAYDKDDDTPLHMAVRQGSVSVAKHLIMGGAKLTIRNNKRLTPLGESLANKKVDMAKLMVENGADMTEKAKGFSLLHLVSGLSDIPSLEFVLNYISPSVAPGPGGVTPLHCAAIGGSANCIDLLIKHGADAAACDEDGRTAYAWAKEGNADESVLKALVGGKGVSKKKGKGKKQSEPPVTEIEPADGPEEEWASFVRMSTKQQLKQVEAWARSPEQLGPLGRLAFLNSKGRAAVAQVGHFMRLIECQRAIRLLQSDEEFQANVTSEEVQAAITDVTGDAQIVEKYMKNPKVMGVLSKLRRLQEVLRRNGQKKIVFDELFASGSSTAEEEEASLVESLKQAKQSVIDAVMGEIMEEAGYQTKASTSGRGWWSTDDENSRRKTQADRAGFWKVIGWEFLRQFGLSVVICALIFVFMWMTKSLPWQNGGVGSGTSRLAPKPAKIVTEDQFEQLIKQEL